jgi:hypothetical protein
MYYTYHYEIGLDLEDIGKFANVLPSSLQLCVNLSSLLLTSYFSSPSIYNITTIPTLSECLYFRAPLSRRAAYHIACIM